MKYICNICGYVYDETLGCDECSVAANTTFDELPESFVCPICGVSKEEFTEE